MSRAQGALRLSVPAGEIEAMPSVYDLFRTAPRFAIDVEEDESACIAEYPQLRESIEAVARLIRAIMSARTVHLRVNGRLVEDQETLLRALRCYQESLGWSIPALHCARQARCVGETEVCRDRGCPLRCPFVCDVCARRAGGPATREPIPSVADRAARAEVEWCPNLPRVTAGT